MNGQEQPGATKSRTWLCTVAPETSFEDPRDSLMEQICFDPPAAPRLVYLSLVLLIVSVICLLPIQLLQFYLTVRTHTNISPTTPGLPC